MTQAARESTFAYRGHAVVVRGAGDTRAWLAEAVAPWFASGAGPAPPDAPIVTARVDPPLVERLRAAPVPGRDVACFTMDRAEERLPVVRAADGTELAFDPTYGFAVGARTGADGRRVVEVVAARERPGLRLALLRVVRELLVAAAIAVGELPLHAAAVADDGGVTLIVGGKRAGKSSLLLHALTHPGTRYVGNDRALVRVGPAPVVHGVPTVVTLREGTLALVPSLGEELASGAWHFASTVAEARAYRAAGRPAAGLGRRRPPGLTAAQLCALLRATPAAGGRLARLVFTTVAPGAAADRRFILRPLAPAEAGARLVADGLVAGGRSARFLPGGAPPEPSALHAAADALAAQVPAFDCVLGRAAYDAPSVWEALRRAA